MSDEAAPQMTASAKNGAGAGGVVAVVGLGKIGLPLAIQYIQHGRRVIGCDINLAVVEGINRGECHVHEEVGMEAEVARAVADGLLRATTDTTAAVREADVVVVIVPVVVHGQGEVAFEGIDAATRAVGKGLHAGALVIYETTLPVGTTSGRFRAILERESNLVAGRDFLLGYSPERVSSGVIFRDLRIYPKVVGGVDAASTAAAVAFYRAVLDAEVIEMRSADDAEFVKLIETTYRDVNIALANEYARFADAHGLDMTAAAAAANTQPYSHIHQPGVGVGGHCIPVYPYFLMRGAAEGGLTLPRRARIVNDAMAEYAVDRIEAVIGPVAGQSVLILGVAYRGDVKETAFTSAALLRDALAARGAQVYADDPLFTDDELRAHGYTPITPERSGAVRALIVQAAHSAYQRLDLGAYPACRVVLDGRRALARATVEAAGMAYVAMGDGRLAAERTRTVTEDTEVTEVHGGGKSGAVETAPTATARSNPVE
ncbi:MAG TPA: nucleotide sugar dehydrogenase [Ktedonobacterales bacterium]|nr:nucleotide sugar dehydrogenase [Ktedonobacterales bacterium]